MKAVDHRPPIDARVLGIQVPVQPDDKHLLLFVQAVYLYDANALDAQGGVLHPVRVDLTFLDEVPSDRRTQLAAKYPLQDAPLRIPTCDLDRLVVNAKAFNYHDHGGTGIGYEEVSYDDQLEGLVDHYRDAKFGE